MKKTHQSPEFIVIKQTQANAKFFVASEGPGGGGGFTSNPPTPTSGTAPANSSSQYDNGGDINM